MELRMAGPLVSGNALAARLQRRGAAVRHLDIAAEAIEHDQGDATTVVAPDPSCGPLDPPQIDEGNMARLARKQGSAGLRYCEFRQDLVFYGQ